MSFAKDFPTNIADAFIKLLMSDQLVSAYPWTRWDDDLPAKMPRGYINMEVSSALVEAGGPNTVRVEIVLEGKPLRQKLSAVMGNLFGLVTDPALHLKLNGYANGTVKFYKEAEDLSIRQTIEGDIRIRRVQFSIQAMALV